MFAAPAQSAHDRRRAGSSVVSSRARGRTSIRRLAPRALRRIRRSVLAIVASAPRRRYASRGDGAESTRYGPAQDAQALAHADETEACLAFERCRVESASRILDGQMDAVESPLHAHLRRRASTVFGDIGQALLRDPEKAQRHVGRQRRGQRIVGEADGDVMTL